MARLSCSENAHGEKNCACCVQSSCDERVRNTQHVIPEIQLWVKLLKQLACTVAAVGYAMSWVLQWRRCKWGRVIKNCQWWLYKKISKYINRAAMITVSIVTQIVLRCHYMWWPFAAVPVSGLLWRSCIEAVSAMLQWRSYKMAVMATMTKLLPAVAVLWRTCCGTWAPCK